MSDNKQNSFETVDLLSPMEMLPIQDVEMPLKETDINKEIIPKAEDVPNENLKNSVWDNNTFYNNPNNEILSPEEIFHRENATRRRFDDNNRKRSVMTVSFVAFMIVMLVVVRIIITRWSGRAGAKDNNQDMPEKIIEKYSDLPISDMVMQDETYGILNLDSLNELGSDYVSVNPEIIEYTGVYERCLYFRVTPKDDNVSVAINVEMIDGNGVSLGAVVGTGIGIPKDHEGIVAVSFGISPSMGLNDITYNISVESRKSSGKVYKRDISDINVENGIIYVSISGEKNIDKYAYMVYYKNNKVVKVDWKVSYIEGAETVVVEFDTKDIDFDSSQIYY